jgi:PKHD-type hydroxylase
MSYTTIFNDPYTRAKFIEPWVYWDNAFTPEELEKIVMYCEQYETTPATIFKSVDQKDVEQYRISNVDFHGRNPDTAWIFDRLNQVIQAANEIYYNFELNGYSKFQYTVYRSEENGHYDWHMDMAIGNTPHDDIEHRKLSLSLCLNDEYKGGEFFVNIGTGSQPADPIETKKGRIILFPSFIIHKVSPITKGTRRSLVAWVLGPKFK